MSTPQASRRNAVVVPQGRSATPRDRQPATAKIDPEWAFGAAVKKREVLGAGGMLALQAAAGNRAVAGLVQAKRERSSTGDHARVHEAAMLGIRGGSGELPYLDTIQKAFGRHDVTGVVAHTGAQATAGAQAMGAAAFTTGNHVAFAGSADLRTAAHVVQQRAGVQLAGGVGQGGDRYERHADAVAGLVVQGRSAERLLDAYEPTHVVKQRSGPAAAPTQARGGMINAGVRLKGGVGRVGDVYERHGDERHGDEIATLVVAGRSAENALDRHGGGGAAVQRKISVKEGGVVYENADAARIALAGKIDELSPRGVRIALELLDRANEVFDNEAALLEVLGAAAKAFGPDIAPDTHAVLHRLKGLSFRKFVGEVHPDTDEEVAQQMYEKTDSKYAPEKFDKSAKHTWAGNNQWLKDVIAKFTKVVLTDLPLTQTNVLRQTERFKDRNFSAYAREIAILLLNKYLPYVENDKYVHMIDVERIDETVAVMVKRGKVVNETVGWKIAEDDRKRVRIDRALRFFHDAGLPTDRREEFDKAPRHFVNDKDPKDDRKEPEPGPEPELGSTSSTGVPSEEEEEEIDYKGLCKLANRILVFELQLPQKNWNKGGSLRKVYEEARTGGVIPKSMSQTRFKREVLEPQLSNIYQYKSQ